MKKYLCHTNNINTPPVQINLTSHMQVFAYIENCIMNFDFFILSMMDE
jgi:hypothetical protein